METIWVYSKRISGTLTAVAPNTAAPTSVTIAGTTYNLGTSDAVFKCSNQGSFPVGSLVTLLLDKGGSVADIVSVSEAEGIYYGLVVSSKKAASTASTSNTTAAAQSQTEVVCTDGVTRTFYTNAGPYTVGRVVSVTVNSSGTTIKSVSTKRLSGKVSRDGTSLAGFRFAGNIEILDTDSEGGCARIYPSRLAGTTLKEENVIGYTLNQEGNIDHLFLRNATGDTYKYVYITGTEKQSEGMNVSSSYSYIQNGQSQSYQSSVQYTMDNWDYCSDTNLYLYLSGKDHTLDVNGEQFQVKWDSASQTFTVEGVETQKPSLPGESVSGGNASDTSVKDGTATTTVDSSELKKLLENLNSGTQLTLNADIPEGTAVKETVLVLDRKDVTAIADTGSALTVGSPVADITLPNAALKDLSGRTGNKVEIRALEQENGVRIEASLDGKALAAVKGGMYVTLPADKPTEDTVLVVVSAGGSRTILDTDVGKDSVSAWVDGSCVVQIASRSELVQNVVLPSKTEVKGGTAATAVDSKALANALKNADSTTQLVIAADIPAGAKVTETVTTLTRGDVRAIGAAEASLKVSSPLADITLSAAGLKDLAGGAAEDDAHVVELRAARKGAATRIEVTVNGEAAETIQGGLLVSLAAAKPTAGTVLVLVNAGGSETVIKKSVTGESAVTARLDGSCSVKAVDRTKAFADVTSTDWYADAITFAASRALFNGTSETTFDPAGRMTRSMLVTVLHRLEDTPEAPESSVFGDVAGGTWYTGAVAWASENGIVTGTGNGFNPDGSVTREQLAAILYRYAQYLKLNTAAKSGLSQFQDGGETSDWAAEAMEWAVGAGIITGKGGTALDPGGSASRAEVATMLQRLIGLMVK